VIDLLSRHPATARFISRKLAIFFVSDDPPQPLVDRMATRFARTDGDIAAVLQTMFESPEFVGSLHARYKDPVHYVVSAVRAAYDDKAILNARPMINWLNRMGEAPYNRQTPDGYPLNEASWAGPGQLTTRFEIAKAIGSGSAGLFKSEEPTPTERPAFPQLSNPLYFEAIRPKLADATRHALDQANSRRSGTCCCSALLNSWCDRTRGPPMNRRQLLRLAASLPLVCRTSLLWAAPKSGGTRFLLVFLRGGLDTQHLLVPIGSDFYYRARPNIAIGRPGQGEHAAIALDSYWGLHPVLEDNLYRLYQAKQLALVPFAGTDDESRSHFETRTASRWASRWPARATSSPVS